MDQPAISQLSDSDLLKTMERTIYDIDYGCWPLHEYIATACRLTLEWTRRQREAHFVPARSAWETWESREKAAGLVLDMVDDCQRFIAASEAQKAAHTAALAANIFFSFGPTTALYDMQKAAKRKSSNGGRGKKGSKSKITMTLEAMAGEMPDCDLVGVLSEFEGDAMGQESLLYNLRERGGAHIRIIKVDSQSVQYCEIGGKERRKTITAKRIGNLLTDLRKSTNKK